RRIDPPIFSSLLLPCLLSFSPHRPLFLPPYFSFFFFSATSTSDIYTLSLHDALPIFFVSSIVSPSLDDTITSRRVFLKPKGLSRSEEHTSELQSHLNLVCRLLLEKKKKK